MHTNHRPRPAARGVARPAGEIRLGFVPLLDAMPLIVAHERGLFAAEGLHVTLHRQIGWGNIRDKLAYGQLDAAHALLGMPAMSVLGRERFPGPIVAVMALGAGGNAITLSRRVYDAGVRSATSLAQWLRPGRPVAPADRATFAHVFGCSTHHYLLRAWLAGGGIDPDRDVRLQILPPPQMTRQIQAGYLDGFCVGEPWNTAAARAGAGTVTVATVDIVPDHPEKVLAVTRAWLDEHEAEATAMIRAILRACGECQDRAAHPRLAELLGQPEYLNLPPETIRACLGSRATFHVAHPDHTAPRAQHVVWLLGEMARWRHLDQSVDVHETAARSVDDATYRAAAANLGMTPPASQRTNRLLNV